MNEMNGTVTLSFVEEDNRQRVIFRVIPLCTREGLLFHGTPEEFPDEGSLRIIPDKREQSTFKERMRGLGKLCAIQLQNETKDQTKVRQNRNYAPENGEKNQLAMYSDVICEFPEDGCFEVLEEGNSTASTLTGLVLIQKNKMLYGPVESDKAATAEGLKPFGNENFLLHTVEAPQIGRHLICWNPDNLLNWRQKRNSLRRKDKSEEMKEPAAAPETAPVIGEASVNSAEMPEETAKPEKPEKREKLEKLEKPEKPEKPEKSEKPEKKTRAERRAENRAAQKKEKTARAEQTQKAQKAEPITEQAPATQKKEEEVLPIGTRLDILDSDISFDDQLDRLAQPLSDGANRLTAPAQEAEPAPEENQETVSHVSGTPLNQPGKKSPKRISTPENVVCVVEKQTREQAGYLVNPIQALREQVEEIWQDPELKRQALQVLTGNQAFMEDISSALTPRSSGKQMVSAAEEQLAEIEAERISLMMDLDTARENEKQYRDNALKKLNQRKRGEIESLTHEVNKLTAARDELLRQQKGLAQENARKAADFLCANASSLALTEDGCTTLTPLPGNRRPCRESAESIRVYLNDCGFSISEDDAVALMICFALEDQLYLQGSNLQETRCFAQLLVESLGLKNVCVVEEPRVALLNLMPAGVDCTPTVSVQQAGTPVLPGTNHKTLLLLGEEAQPLEDCIPVIRVPKLGAQTFRNAVRPEEIPPLAASSLTEVAQGLKGLLTEGKKWFSDLSDLLKENQVELSQPVLQHMEAFAEAASGQMRGGFPVAADQSVCLWVVRKLQESHKGMEILESISAGLTKTSALLK